MNQTPKPEQFKESTNAPVIMCSSCGEKKQAKFTYSISLESRGLDGDFMLVCCSRECVDNLCSNPITPSYIDDMIDEIVRMNS